MFQVPSSMFQVKTEKSDDLNVEHGTWNMERLFPEAFRP
jgi:hypothetical protein